MTALMRLVEFAITYVIGRVGQGNPSQALVLIGDLVPDLIEQFGAVDRFDADARVRVMEFVDARLRDVGL